MSEENKGIPEHNPDSASQTSPAEQPTQAAPEQSVQEAPSVQQVSPVQPTPPAQQAPPAPQAPGAHQPPPAQPVPSPQADSAYPPPPPPGQAPQAYYEQPPVPPASTPSNGKAIAGLVFGILAILFSPTVFFGIIFGIVALVLGILAVKKPAKDGKATAAKVCGSLGIAFSVILLVIGLVFGSLLISEVDRQSSSSSSSSKSQGITGSSSEELDEAAIIEQTESIYDDLKTPSAHLRAKLVDDYNEEFESLFGFTMAQAGIDADETLQVTLDSLSYGTTTVLISSSGTSATASTTVNSLDIWSLAYDTSVETNKRIEAGEVIDFSTAEGRAKVGEIFKGLTTTMRPLPNSVTLEFTKSGDTWEVSEESLEEEIEYIFGTY